MTPIFSFNSPPRSMVNLAAGRPDRDVLGGTGKFVAGGSQQDALVAATSAAYDRVKPAPQLTPKGGGALQRVVAALTKSKIKQ